ncbi:MAG: hypothetical protein IKZ25_02480 [Clostridia bacterium]|nr:hypothetical protein [Clostridia bacterium]
MSLFKFFHSTKTLEEDIQREKDCILRIKNAVSQKCGIDNFIDYDDFTVAFAGSKDNMELMLEICTQKCQGKKYLYASVDDEVSWQEWDFNNLDEFENNIIEYIANRVNRTVKTVIKKVKHKSYQETVYYLDNETNEWVLMEDDQTEDKFVCFIAANKTETNETIKTYKLQTSVSWDDKYKKLDLAQGKLQTICDDDQDMLLITYEDGMQIDVGYIIEDKTYYITVVKDDTIESWNNPLGKFATTEKTKLSTELQKAIYKFRNI